jgi:hypothetical protein
MSCDEDKAQTGQPALQLLSPLEAKPELLPLQTIRLILQLNCQRLNVTVDTEFTAQYHSPAFGLTVKPGRKTLRIQFPI